MRISTMSVSFVTCPSSEETSVKVTSTTLTTSVESKVIVGPDGMGDIKKIKTLTRTTVTVTMEPSLYFKVSAILFGTGLTLADFDLADLFGQAPSDIVDRVPEVAMV